MLLRAAASFFVPAGMAFNWRVGFGLRVLSLYLPTDSMQQLAKDNGTPLPTQMELREPAHDPVLEHYAALIQHEYARTQNLSEHFLAPVARLLGLHCLRNYLLREPIKEAAPTLAPEFRKRLDDFIVKTLPNAVVIEELAQALGLSQYQLIRLMKKTLAISPQQYVQERRMDLARKLLRESDSALADIAYALGFSSQSHFTSAFRASTGHTPKAYRERPDLI
jgi:AraC family transcriptional regulator